jgi:hypothetical protein
LWLEKKSWNPWSSPHLTAILVTGTDASTGLVMAS